MILALLDIEVELREIVLKNKPQSLLDYSAKGTIPVLILIDGQVIDESRDIIDWALAKAKTNNQQFDLSDSSLKNQELVTANDLDFKPWLDRYKYFERHPRFTQSYYLSQCQPFLDQLEGQLTNSIFLAGPKPGYADIAIFPFIRQFAAVDKNWFEQAPYSQLRRWLDFFINNKTFIKVMRKYQPWQPANQPVYTRDHW